METGELKNDTFEEIAQHIYVSYKVNILGLPYSHAIDAWKAEFRSDKERWIKVAQTFITLNHQGIMSIK